MLERRRRLLRLISGRRWQFKWSMLCYDTTSVERGMGGDDIECYNTVGATVMGKA